MDSSLLDPTRVSYIDSFYSGSPSLTGSDISDSSLYFDSFDDSYTSAVDTECSVSVSLNSSSTLTATLLQSQLSDVSSLPPHFLRISPLPTDISLSNTGELPYEGSVCSPSTDIRIGFNSSTNSHSSFGTISPTSEEVAKFNLDSPCFCSDMDSFYRSITPETLRVSSLNAESIVDASDASVSVQSMDDFTFLSSSIRNSGNLEDNQKELQNSFDLTTENAVKCSPMSTTMNSLSSLPTDTVTMNVPCESSNIDTEVQTLSSQTKDNNFNQQSDPSFLLNFIQMQPMDNNSSTHDTAYGTENSVVDSPPISSPTYTESCTITPTFTNHITPCSTNPTCTPIPSPIPTEVLYTSHSDAIYSSCSMLTSSNADCISQKLQELIPNNVTVHCSNKINLTTSKSNVHDKNSIFQCSETSDVNSRLNDQVEDSIEVEELLNNPPDRDTMTRKLTNYRKASSLPARSPKETKHPFWKPYSPKGGSPIPFQEGVLPTKNFAQKGSKVISASSSYRSTSETRDHSNPAFKYTDKGTKSTTESMKSSVNCKNYWENKTQDRNDILEETSESCLRKETMMEIKQSICVGSGAEPTKFLAKDSEKKKETSAKEATIKSPISDSKKESQFSQTKTNQAYNFREKLPPIPPPPIDEDVISPPPVPSLPPNLVSASSDEAKPSPPPRRYLLVPLDLYDPPRLSPPPTPIRSSSLCRSPQSQVYSGQQTHVSGNSTSLLSVEQLGSKVNHDSNNTQINRENGHLVSNCTRSRINSLTPVPEEQILSPNSSPIPPNIDIGHQEEAVSQPPLTKRSHSLDPQTERAQPDRSKSSSESTSNMNCSDISGSPKGNSSVFIASNNPDFTPISSPVLNPLNSYFKNTVSVIPKTFSKTKQPNSKRGSTSPIKILAPVPSIQIPPQPTCSPPSPLFCSPSPPLPCSPPPPITCSSLASFPSCSPPTPCSPPPPPPPIDSPPPSPPPPPSITPSPSPPIVPPLPQLSQLSSLSSLELPPPPPQRVCSLPNSPLFKNHSNGFFASKSPFILYRSKASHDLSSTEQKSAPCTEAKMSSEEHSVKSAPSPPPPPLPPSAFSPGPYNRPSEKNSLMSISPYGKLVVDRKDLPLETPEEEIRKAYTRAASWGWLCPDVETISVYTQIEPLIQNGPQCGLVALSMASQVFGSKVPLEALLRKAQSLGISKHGEMFNAKDFASLAREFLKGVTVTVFENILCDPQHVAEMLQEGNLLLVPYDSEHNHMPCQQQGKRAHWALVCGCLVQTVEMPTLPGTFKASPDVQLDHLWHLKPKRSPTPSKTDRSNNAETPTSPETPNQSMKEWARNISKMVVIWRQGKSRGLSVSPLEDLLNSNRQLMDHPHLDDYVIKSVKEGLCNKVVILKRDKPSLTELIDILKESD